MMTTNQEFKNAALAALKGNWAPAVLASIVYFLVIGAFSGSQYLADPITQATLYSSLALGTVALSFFIGAPMAIGYYDACRQLYVKGDSEMMKNTFRGFNNYFHNLWTMFLMGLLLVFWFMLLIVPGIIMGFAYSMTPFIVKDEPELTALQAIKKSRAMMKGHKFDLFWLELSFIGWGILSILTLGIGLFWLMPYMYTSISVFYEELKADQQGAPAVAE